MSDETKNGVDYAMEAASGPHFSGLHLRSSPPPLHSSSSSLPNSSDAHKQPFIIGVSGGTASGKTTVCDMIIQQLHDHRVVLVNQDSFYRGLTPEESKLVHEYNFDHPDAFDTEELLECVEKLKLGQSVHVPIYDFVTHRKSTDSFRQMSRKQGCGPCGTYPAYCAPDTFGCGGAARYVRDAPPGVSSYFTAPIRGGAGRA